MQEENVQYGVEQIDSLVGLEAIQKRPGMYIGSTSQKGINQLLWEVIDNSIDEYIGGYGNEINITINKDYSVMVEDHGRGIPVGEHHSWKNDDGTPMNTLTGVLTKLHAGGKFGKDDSAYVNGSAGLHGIGVKATNALSSFLHVTVKREGNIYQQKFKKGDPVTNVEIIGNCDKKDTGTIVEYLPDNTIFKLTIEPNCKEIQNRLNELASLNKGLKINYKNAITNIDKQFYYKEGIVGLVKRMAGENNLLYDAPVFIEGKYKLPNNKNIVVEATFIHVDVEEPNETIKSYVNNINTYEGGFHLQGFRNEYKKQLNIFATNNKLIQDPLELRYLFDGIYLIISLKMSDVEFEGQTKTKLGTSEAQQAVEGVLNDFFSKTFKTKELNGVLESIIIKAQKAKEAEEAARKARLMVRTTNKVAKMALPGKLADCSTKNGYSELFLVEGDSAAGSAKSARNSTFQAILPLRGKLLNTEKSDFDKMVNSDTIKNIIAALGAGVGKTFDVKKLRYDKIIILSDADIDGSHICALLLTFFYNYMRPIFDHNILYIAIPPLYRVIKNKDSVYLRDDHELKEYKQKNKNIIINRFKGLGEMNPAQLKETTMDPTNRLLKRITIKDSEQATQSFNVCMGNNVQLRRDFIEANANKIELE